MMLIAIAVLLPSLASADVPAWEWGPKYMGEMHIGYGTSRKQNGYKALLRARDAWHIAGRTII